MNTWKKSPITLVVADAGPLIGLAIADRLELLQSFGRPVLIVDVVLAECLRQLGAPGEARLRHWFEVGGGNQFQLVTTPLKIAWEEALRQEATGKSPRATKGMGDATISWLLANLDLLRSPDDVALVLTEDAPFGDGPVLSRRHAHVVSTREWLKTLERLQVIPSAKDVLAEMEAAGRKVSRYLADRPAILDRGARSDWVDGVQETARQCSKDKE